jgi:hypothetical protein
MRPSASADASEVNVSASPLSCLLALPVEDLAEIGLANFHDPTVTIAFEADPHVGVTVIESTVSNEVMGDWFQSLTFAEASPMMHRRLRLHLDAQTRSLTEDGGPVTDQRLAVPTDKLFEHMVAWRGVLADTVKTLPSLDALRSDIEGFLRARIDLARRVQPRRLDGAFWMMRTLCGDHHPNIEGFPQRALYAFQQADHDSFVGLVSRAAHHPVFSVPLVTPGSCEDERTPAQRFRENMLGNCAEALIKELVPQLYNELVPGRHPAPDVLPTRALESLGDELGVLSELLAR